MVLEVTPERLLCFPSARLFVERERDGVDNWNGKLSTFGFFIFAEL